MIRALAIDTTSEMLSLALAEDGRVAAWHHSAAGTEMNRTILLVIDGLLQEAGFAVENLDVIVAARGPGSFTGTRIGLAVAKSFAQIEGLPLIGVDTLRLLAAQTVPEEGRLFYAALNCTRDEVYHAPFRWRGEAPRREAEIVLGSLAELAETAEDAPVVLRRFLPGQAGHEATLARLKPMALAHPDPDATLLLREGLRDYLQQPQGAPASMAPVAPIYLKSEAFRKWKR